MLIFGLILTVVALVLRGVARAQRNSPQYHDPEAYGFLGGASLVMCVTGFWIVVAALL